MKSVILILSIFFAVNLSAQEIRIDSTNSGKVNSISIIEVTDSVIYSQTYVMKGTTIRISRNEAQDVLVKIKNEVKNGLPNSDDEGEEVEGNENESVQFDALKTELERAINILDQFERNVEEWKEKVRVIRSEIQEGRLAKRNRIKAINEAINQLK